MATPSIAAMEDKSRGRLSRAVNMLRDLGPSGVFHLLREHGLTGAASFATRNVRYLLADRLVRRWDRVNIAWIQPDQFN